MVAYRIEIKDNSRSSALHMNNIYWERAVVLSAGCDDFLRKPFREADIFALMTKHIGVRFVYEDEQPVEATATTADLPALLAQVPADLREQLRHAVEHSDMDLIDRVIGDIRTYQPSAVDILTEWANNFRYENILSTLSEAVA